MGLEKINIIRKEKGITIEKLSTESGIPVSTIKKITAGITLNPNLDTLKALTRALGCRLDDIDDSPIARGEFSDDEFTHIKKYRILDPHGKEVVRNLLDAEHRRITEIQQEQAQTMDTEDCPKTRFIEFYQLPVSAGSGIEIVHEGSDMIEIPYDDKSSHADFVLRVSGNSMEPLYQSGDLILIQSMPTVNIGDLGIFIIDNEAFFKKRGKSELISLNSQCPNIPIHEFDKIDCKGKVLGKVLV